MIKLILLVALTTGLFAQNDFLEPGFFNTPDKRKHFTVSAGIGMGAAMYAKHKGLSNTESFLAGFGTSILVGWLKEVSDGEGYGNKDINDMDADAVGAITGSLTGTLINWQF